MRTLMLILLSMLLVIPAAGQRSISLNLQSAPVFTENVEASQSGRSVEFSFRYRNINPDTVQAVQFGLVSVGAFGEPVGYGTVTEVGELTPYNPTRDRARGTYSLVALGASRHYTGIVYTRKVRFKGGEVWVAPPDSVSARLEKIVQTEGFVLPDDTTEVQEKSATKI